MATACSIVEDGFSSLDNGRSVVVNDIKDRSRGDFGFEGDGGECKTRIFDGLDDEEQNLWLGVSIRNEEEKNRRKEENVEGLVCKSKKFLPMNLSKPKGVSLSAKEGKYLLFGHDETGCVGGGRLKTAGLTKKLAKGFSQGFTLGFFNSSNWAWVFGSFFLLIIHIQRGKLHFGLHGKNEEIKGKEALLTYKKLFHTNISHGPYCM